MNRKNFRQQKLLKSIGIIIFLLFVFLAPLTKRLFEEKTSLKNRATENPNQETTPTIDQLRFSYKDLLSIYEKLQSIQLFGGGTVLAEFDDETGNLYAGHLGSFWAPPFFSDYGTKDWENGFNLGLVFSDGSLCFTESPTDPNTESAFWYPSKTVVKKQYDKIEVTGTRIPLPGKRGFALKLSLENKTTTPQNFKVLFLGNLISFDILKEGYASSDSLHFYGPWVWLMKKKSDPQNANATYNPNTQTIVIENLATINQKNNKKNEGFIAITLSDSLSSWELNDSKRKIYDSFRGNCQLGQLKNSDNDTNEIGSSFGLVGNFDKLEASGSNQDSKTITLVISIGETKQEALEIINNFKNKDIEQEADSWWNKRLEKVFSSFPSFSSGDPLLGKLFKNSLLTYLVNYWETFGTIGEAAGYGQAVGFFPWMTGTTGFFPLADSSQWKNQLTKIMLDKSFYQNCRAFDFVGQDNLCNNYYAYSTVSVIEAIYKYLVTTGEFQFLNEKVYGVSVFDHLLEYLKIDEQRPPQNSPVKDFGNDWNLYEYPRHSLGCGLGGQYTGQVISPNFERVIAYRQVSELAGQIGKENLEQELSKKAQELEKEINKILWDNNQGWFKTLSWYPECESLNCPRNNEPKITYFYNIAPYFLLQYNDLLTKDQKEKLLSRFNNFVGENGLYSLDQSIYKSSSGWCSDQADWHGPGLYSGAVGAVLTGLFKNERQNLAYEILQKYYYLEKAPYFSQAFSSERKQLSQPETQSLAYLEGLSLAQSLIEGMFGIQFKTKTIRIEPNIPSDLLSLGKVSLENLKVQERKYSISIEPDKVHNIEIDASYKNKEASQNKNEISFEYNTNGRLNILIKNLYSQKTYLLNIRSLPSREISQTIKTTTDNNGTLNTSVNLTGLSLIEVFLPKFCQIEAPSLVSENEEISFQTIGTGNKLDGEPVRLYLQKENGEKISPLPQELQGKEGRYTDGKYRYYLGSCTSENLEPCSLSFSLSSLPIGDYVIHCDLPTDPPPTKCSGCPFCSFPIGGGTIDCSDWVRCSDQDRASFSVISTPTPRPTTTPLPPTATPQPTATPTPRPTATPTPRPTATSTPTPTPTPKPTATPAPTFTPIPTTATPQPTATPTPTPIPTPITPTPTPSSSPSPTSPLCQPSNGDINNDGKIDIFDYSLLIINYGKQGEPGQVTGDLDCNGKVDIFDFSTLIIYYREGA